MAHRNTRGHSQQTSPAQHSVCEGRDGLGKAVILQDLSKFLAIKMFQLSGKFPYVQSLVLVILYELFRPTVTFSYSDTWSSVKSTAFINIALPLITHVVLDKLL